MTDSLPMWKPIELSPEEIQDRLQKIRDEIELEQVSYGELAELQRLAAFVDPADTLLREWAGFAEDEHEYEEWLKRKAIQGAKEFKALLGITNKEN